MILVTGATGNIGNELVHALVARDEPVRALARNPHRAAVPGGVDLVSGDLDAPDTVTPALAGVHKVFLLGGFATNELLRRTRDAGVEHVVLLTSRCVVGGKPDNAITRMWLDAEAAVRDAGLRWTILRPSGFHANALRWLPQLREATSCVPRGRGRPSRRSTRPTSRPWRPPSWPNAATSTPRWGSAGPNP